MTNTLNFITNNSGLLMALLMAIVGLVSAIVSKNKQQVYSKVYALVSEAQLLKKANGVDKFNYVFDNAYKALPTWLKFFISEDNIKMAIEYSLTKLKAFAASQMEATNISALASAVSINNTTEEVKQVTTEKVIADDAPVAKDITSTLSPQDAINQINEIVKNLTGTATTNTQEIAQ